MKKYYIIILYIVILMTLVSCGNQHIAKRKKDLDSNNSTISLEENKQNEGKNIEQGKDIMSISDRDNKAIEESKNTQINYDILQNGLLLQTYISRIGKQDAIRYNDDLNRVKETGKMVVYDNASNSLYIEITLADYVNYALNNILTKYPDINERNGADWDYINMALNLLDYSTYYSAFYECDNGINRNYLTGIFNSKNEIDFFYNTFISKTTMEEKAKYLKGVIDQKKTFNRIETTVKDNITETKYVNGHRYELQNTPNGKMWVDLDDIDEEQGEEEYDNDYSYSMNMNNENYGAYSSNNSNDITNSAEEIDISTREYEVRDDYPKYVLKYNEEDGHSYNDLSLPSLYNENGYLLVSFQHLAKNLDTKFSSRLYDFSKDNHVCQIEFDNSEITSKTKNGIVVTIYGTVEWTNGDTKSIEVQCKCDKNFTATDVSYILKD